jgi:hypothetical protein
VLGRPEVLGEPALGVEVRVLDLAVAVEQHDGGARRRIGGERADEAPARLRGPQRVLEAGAHEIEDVAVALGELTLGTAEAGDDHLTTPRADADRDPYSTPDRWSRSPYNSLWDRRRGSTASERRSAPMSRVYGRHAQGSGEWLRAKTRRSGRTRKRKDQKQRQVRRAVPVRKPLGASGP